MARGGMRMLVGLAGIAGAAVLLLLVVVGPCGGAGEDGEVAPPPPVVGEAPAEPPGTAPRPRARAAAAVETPDAAESQPAADGDEPRRLRVLCVHAETGAPIPNLRVEMTWPSRSPWGRTGADGVWLAPQPPGAARVRAGEDAEVDGRWYEDTELPVAAGAAEVRVEVRPSGVVTGVVVGPDGTPIPRADLVVHAGPRGRSATTDSAGEFALRVREGTRLELELRYFDGDFWRGSSGPVTATAHDVRIRADRDPLDAVLDVLVLDPDGRPVPGAEVATGFTARSVRLRSDGSAFSGMGAGTTGEDGRVRLTGLPRYPLGIRANPPASHGAVCVSGSEDGIAARGQQVTVSLGRGSTLRGRVVDPAGEAVPFAAVRILEAPWEGPRCQIATGRTDGRGEFRVEVPADATGPFVCIALDSRRKGETRDVAAGASDVRIVLAAAE